MRRHRAAAAVIALLLCNSNFIMLQKTKGPSAKNGRMSQLDGCGDALQAVLDGEAGPANDAFPFLKTVPKATQQRTATPPSRRPRLVNLVGGRAKSLPHKFSTAAMATDSPGVVASRKPKAGGLRDGRYECGRQCERAHGHVRCRRLRQVGALPNGRDRPAWLLGRVIRPR